MKKIYKKFIGYLMMVPIIFNLSGCVYLVVGGLGALGGYVVSPDTIEGVTESDALTVWDSAIEVISVMGVIERQEEEAGLLVTKINRAHVTITISSINETTTKISVKARKAWMPRISTAQDVYVKIMSYLNE